MKIRQAIEEFAAMDDYGNPQIIPKFGILHSVGDGSGFRGRIEVRELASFVYLGCLFYVGRDAVEIKTKPMAFGNRKQVYSRPKRHSE
jgi:hypothetical protein